MPKTSTERARTFQQRRRKAAKERAKMFAQFAAAFPGQIRFSLFPGDDPYDELTDPVQIRIYFPDGQKPAIAAFAHKHGLSVDDLFDQLAEEMNLRLISRGMLPNVVRTLVE